MFVSAQRVITILCFISLGDWTPSVKDTWSDRILCLREDTCELMTEECKPMMLHVSHFGYISSQEIKSWMSLMLYWELCNTYEWLSLDGPNLLLSTANFRLGW